MRNLSFCMCAYQLVGIPSVENIYCNQGALSQHYTINTLHRSIMQKYNERRTLYFKLLNINNYLSVHDSIKRYYSKLENFYQQKINEKNQIEEQIQNVQQQIDSQIESSFVNKNNILNNDILKDNNINESITSFDESTYFSPRIKKKIHKNFSFQVKKSSIGLLESLQKKKRNLIDLREKMFNKNILLKDENFLVKEIEKYKIQQEVIQKKLDLRRNIQTKLHRISSEIISLQLQINTYNQFNLNIQ